jgi:hypothetical protein
VLMPVAFRISYHGIALESQLIQATLKYTESQIIYVLISFITKSLFCNLVQKNTCVHVITNISWWVSTIKLLPPIKWIGLALMPKTCIQDLQSSNPGWDTGCPDWGLSWCSLVSPGRCWVVPFQSVMLPPDTT